MEELDLINIADLSESEILAAIRKDPTNICQVEKTEERCLVAVQQAGYLLKVIPKAIQTYKICLAAVSQNGLAIKHVAKKLLCKELYLVAVRSNAKVLRRIPEEYLDDEVLNAAISADGSAIQYVPQGKRTEILYRKAIQQNSEALQYIPKKFLTKQLIAEVIAQDGLALEYVSGNCKSKALCETAVLQNPAALEFVPNRFKSVSLCEKAVATNWRVFGFIAENMLTSENCVKFLQYLTKYYAEEEAYSRADRDCLRDIFACLPDEINDNLQVISLQRQLRVRYFTEKFFDPEKRIFIARENLCHHQEVETREFRNFIEFYTFLDGDLTGANLYDYDFHDIDLTKYSIDGARIRSSVLVEQGLYDSSFYNKTISDMSANTALTLSAGNELVPAEAVLHEPDICTTLNDTSRKIYYISDIHLNHKLLKAFPHHATKYEIVDFISQTVNTLLATATAMESEDFLLIAGDVSFNYEISVIFYRMLAQKLKSKNIIVTLGNHELWDYSYLSPKHPSDDRAACIEQYRNLFSELGITFLHNDLFILQGYAHHIIREDQLNIMDPDQLRSLCLYSNLIVFGGLGYSGYNPAFNALSGLYRNAITSLEDDIAETRRFERLYDMLNGVIGDLPVIVLTHTQKENWSKKEINRNWIYVNGHTHRNSFFCDDEKTVYSDNQIGYYNKVGLKFFRLSKTYDVFRYYPDGIHTISREQYLEFNRGMQINCTFNRPGGTIRMLKNSGVYCFVYETDIGKYLLNGGAIKRLKRNNLDYYYKRLPVFSSTVKRIFIGYHNALKAISESVKKLGGDGTIHGSIIDIDFYNHLYISPKVGTITPYYALSIVEKYVYPDVRTLLLEQRKDLYDNYMHLLSGHTDGVLLLDGASGVPCVDIARFAPETYIYKSSRIMRSIQYLTDCNIVRIWDEKVLESLQDLSDKVLLIDSDSINEN